MARFPGARLAFRTWKLEGGVLRAAGGDAWVNGEPSAAKCDATHPRGEPIPSAKCSCGFHAYYRTPEDLYIQTGVLGAVIMWGKAALQSDGLRTEFALPVALCKLPTMQVGVYEAAQLYCEEWELPWCETVEELIEEGERYAEMVPAEEWTKHGDPDAVQTTWEQKPPPRFATINGTALPRIQAARRPYQRGKRRHDQRKAARARVRAKRQI